MVVCRNWIAFFFLSFSIFTFGSVTSLQAETIQTVEANGISFSYLEEGAGPLILLIHGYPETARSWGAVQKLLAAEGYRVVAPFTRGYPPTSAAEDADYSVRALGADVVALIEALGEEKAILVGHDWGASTVYEAATLAPEKTVKLVALSVPHARAVAGDPTILLSAPHFLYYQLPFISSWVAMNDYSHIDRIYEAWAPTYEVPDSVLADIKTTMKEPGGLEGPLGYYWALFDDELNEGRVSTPESEVVVPSLIIGGADDGTVNADLYAAAEPAFVEGYKLEVLEGVGHFPQLEAPQQVAELILEFLKN
jgi:pimeloyl-ACP methyl ester carboxylesterase